MMSDAVGGPIITASENQISRTGFALKGAENIVLAGRDIVGSHVVIRGDLRRTAADDALERREADLVRSHIPLYDQYSGVGPGESSGLSGRPVCSVGRYAWLDEQVVLTPPAHVIGGRAVYWPVTIGEGVHIGARSKIAALAIGSNVRIGADCSIGDFCIIRDACLVDDGVTLPPGTVVPPLTRVSSVVDRRSGEVTYVMTELSHGLVDLLREDARRHWRKEFKGRAN